MGDWKPDIFLDSGAFSAYTKGLTIDLQEYMDFISTYADAIKVYANLDVIGDPKATLKNQKKMEQAGFSPIPCYHCGEPIKYLEYYLDNYEYIALGGMVGQGMRNLLCWLDDLFSGPICDADGLPRVKVHGFGITSLTILKRYPWYSVDSTSWVMTSRTGGIIVPVLVSGKWDYIKEPLLVSVSSRGAINDKSWSSSRYFGNLSKNAQSIVLRFLEEMGFCLGSSDFFEVNPKKYKLKQDEVWAVKYSPDRALVEKVVERGVSNSYLMRDSICVDYFIKLQEALPKWPWSFTSRVNKGFGIV